MITLKQFLNPVVDSPQDANPLQAMESGYICALTDLSLIEVTGENAAEFLHNQLSNDVQHLDTRETRFAAYCSPKGRMLASFLFWKADATIYLQLSSTLQETIQKRLSHLHSLIFLLEVGASIDLKVRVSTRLRIDTFVRVSVV